MASAKTIAIIAGSLIVIGGVAYYYLTHRQQTTTTTGGGGQQSGGSQQQWVKQYTIKNTSSRVTIVVEYTGANQQTQRTKPLKPGESTQIQLLTYFPNIIVYGVRPDGSLAMCGPYIKVSYLDSEIDINADGCFSDYYMITVYNDCNDPVRLCGTAWDGTYGCTVLDPGQQATLYSKQGYMFTVSNDKTGKVYVMEYADRDRVIKPCSYTLGQYKVTVKNTCNFNVNVYLQDPSQGGILRYYKNDLAPGQSVTFDAVEGDILIIVDSQLKATYHKALIVQSDLNLTTC